MRSQASSIKLATNVSGLEDRDIRGQLAERLALPVSLENDINLAALGERWRGVARGVDDFVFISIGTGLGAGLVLRGELHRGHSGAAGELDYLRVGMTEDIDPCADALVDFARTVAAPEPHDARSIFAAARAGDVAASRVVAEAARRIALHLAPIAAVTDVGLVVLGGGIGANGTSSPSGVCSKAGSRRRRASRCRASATERCSPARSRSACAPPARTSS